MPTPSIPADGFNVIRNDANGIPFTAESAAAAVADGDYPVAIVFPAGFTDTLSDPADLLADGSGPVTVKLITDPASTLQRVAPIQGAVSGVIQQTAGQMLNLAGMEQLFQLLELPHDTRAPRSRRPRARFRPFRAYPRRRPARESPQRRA